MAATRLFTARKITKAIAWTAIGTNLYIFAKWNIHIPPKDLRDSSKTKTGKLDETSPAYRAMIADKYNYMCANYTLSAHNIDEGRWQTLLTSAFSHRSATHLGLNMFMLYQAATIASLIGLGPLRVVALGLGSALGGSLGALYDNTSRRRQGGEGGDTTTTTTTTTTTSSSSSTADDPPHLGASGMVQGMLVATACAAPQLPMTLMFVPVPIAYSYLVAGFVAWDMYQLYEERERGERGRNWAGSYVGYAAHLGGAVFGAAFYVVAMRRGRRVPFRRG